MKIILKKIYEVKPYWRNPRNNHAVIEALKKSIKEFGFNQPVVIDKDGIVIVGHARLKACIELGFTEVPCVVADITPQKAKQYRIADNKLSEIASWDMKTLIPELREMENSGDMAIFFPKENIEEMLKESVGAMNFTYPTEKQFADQAEHNKSHFENVYKSAASLMCDVACPSCGNIFTINKNEIK